MIAERLIRAISLAGLCALVSSLGVLSRGRGRPCRPLGRPSPRDLRAARRGSRDRCG